MAEKFEIQIEAELFIHNDLESCALYFHDAMHEKLELNERAGIYFETMGSLIFSAFAIEAKVNYVGWKVLKNGWPERASLSEKIDLLIEVLELDLSWGETPLQTISQLKRFRDTIAHGKPEIKDESIIANVKSDVRDALKGQWESMVTPDNVDRCCEDIDTFWKMLLDAAKIPVGDTLTHGEHSLTTLITE